MLIFLLAPPEIAYGYGTTTYYIEGDTSTTLSFKYYPPNGYKYYTKCYFLQPTSTIEQQVAFHQEGKSQWFGALKNRPVNVDSSQPGTFNLTLTAPSQKDQGQYRCVFNTNRSTDLSAVVTLTIKQGNSYYIIQHYYSIIILSKQLVTHML